MLTKKSVLKNKRKKELKIKNQIAMNSKEKEPNKNVKKMQ